MLGWLWAPSFPVGEGEKLPQYFWRSIWFHSTNAWIFKECLKMCIFYLFFPLPHGDEFPGSYEKLSILKRRHSEKVVLVLEYLLLSPAENMTQKCWHPQEVISWFPCSFLCSISGRWKWALLRERGSLLWKESLVESLGKNGRGGRDLRTETPIFWSSL